MSDETYETEIDWEAIQKNVNWHNFCRNCGTHCPLPRTKFCPNCGTKQGENLITAGEKQK